MVVFNNILAGASGTATGAADTYQISKSLRFNAADSSNLSKTFSGTSSTTFTLSYWIKRSKLGAWQYMWSQYDGSSYCGIAWSSNDRISLYNGGHSFTTAFFRDVSAFYHICLKVSSGSATLYVNNAQVATASNFFLGGGNSQIGEFVGGGSYGGNQYIADFQAVSDQALNPTDFAEYDSNNVWVAKEFTGSYTVAASGSTTSLSQVGWASSDQANIWDGNTSTRAVGYNNNSVGTISFSPPLTNVTKVEVYTQNYNHFLNGASVSASGSGNPGWYTLYDSSSPITLTSVGNAYSTNTQTVDFYAIRINDTIVNAQTWTPPSGVGLQGGGANSFYLKFADNSSNAALGTDSSGNSNTWTVNNLQATGSNFNQSSTWSSDLSSPDGTLNNAANAFDGSTTTYAETQNAGETIQLTFSPSINCTSSLNIKSRQTVIGGVSSGWNLTYKVYTTDSGTAAFTQTKSNGQDFNYSPSNWNNDPISKIEVIALTLTTLVAQFVVDGQPLTDPAISDPLATGIDSLIDTPTNYTADSGNNGGNYCTLNSLDSSLGSNLTNGNLDAAGSSSWSAAHVRGTIGVTSGKWFWEVTRTGGSGGNAFIGFGNKAYSLTESFGSTPANSWLFNFGNGTEVLQPNGAGTGYFSGSGMGVGDTVGIALDMDNQTAVFYKNGTAGASISLSSTKTASTDNVTELFPIVGVYSANVSFNAGQRPFSQTVPTGYSSICTTNLPEPTISDPSTAFDALTYTGSSSPQTVSGLSFASDLIWIKSRSHTAWHILQDSIRGFGKTLFSNDSNAEVGNANDLISNVSATGFSVNTNYNSGTDTSTTTTSGSNNYIAWAFDAGNTRSYVAEVSGSFNAGSGADKIFDGLITTQANGAGAASSTFTWTLASPITVNTSLEVYLIDGKSKFTVNGGTQSSALNNSSWQDLGFTGSLSSLQVQGDTGVNCAPRLAAIRIDGTIITDPCLNTSGSINAIVKANPSTGFSIVTYTGSANGTVGHGLNAAPEFILTKSRTVNKVWIAYHKDLGINKYLILNSTAAAGTSSNVWGSSAPTSSVFSLENSSTGGNTDGDLVAYCISPVSGYSAVGSYSGTGSQKFIYTGFKPAFILLKSTNNTGSWHILDNSRDAFNGANNTLSPNLSNAESSGHPDVDFVSNGFTLQADSTGYSNYSGFEYVYIAIAEHPLKHSRAR